MTKAERFTLPRTGKIHFALTNEFRALTLIRGRHYPHPDIIIPDVGIIRNQAEALEAGRRLFLEKKIESILLCPGFTHRDIAEIVEATARAAGSPSRR
jgi:hypothetical protein